MRFDAIVIGSGQGGNPLVYALADHGWTVALIEKAYLGGTCVNTGCTPTKTMVASAQIAHYARSASRWGVEVENVRVNLPAVLARKNAVVQNFRAGHERSVAKRPNVHLYRGHARFLAPRKLQIADDVIEGERIFINVGTRPEPPPLEGLETAGYLTNESLMELQQVPEHLIVLGGGYIGLEFGQMFRRFGSRVTVIHRGNQLLAREDADVAEGLQKALEGEGVEFRMNANPIKVEKQQGRINVTIATGQQTEIVTGTHMLAATGRRPNTDDLGLDKAGVPLDSRGYIKVNGRLETAVPGIWALGDVKGGPAFTHISYDDFRILRTNVLENGNASIEGRLVPYVLFTDPELGRIGLTETEARAQNKKIRVAKMPMSYVARALETDESRGFMKAVVDATTNQILGAAILGIEGGEIMSMLEIAIMGKLPYTALRDATLAHPTLAESLNNLFTHFDS